MISAITEVMTVPYMNARMPNCPAPGSTSLLVTKEIPSEPEHRKGSARGGDDHVAEHQQYEPAA